jgi:GDP/UDP-N,N'-diacetylbacillosamine 2-epimerase (hydrolysing)
MKRARRRICVVTGSRADFGLLRWLMHEIADDGRLELQVIATGMHLDPRFGATAAAITDAGFTIDRRVPMLQPGDDAVAVTKSTGLGVIGMADALADLRPDLLVLLGDRFEIFAAAQAALFARIPIAHIHGGESTTGALDDSMRHAITKLSHLHFVAAPAYRDRVVQLGEAPARVFTVGAIGNDNFTRLRLMDRPTLQRSLGWDLGDAQANPLFLITYHPATLGQVTPARATAALLTALDHFPDATMIFSGVNADPGHAAITPLVEAFVRRHARARVIPSLGQERYLSAMRAAAVVIGNSSSGLLEAPTARTATVNIGPRQDGRLRASSVIDCTEDATAIRRAITRALSPAFQRHLRKAQSPTAGKNVSRRIKTVLARVRLEGLVNKTFHDLSRKPR